MKLRRMFNQWRSYDANETNMHSSYICTCMSTLSHPIPTPLVALVLHYLKFHLETGLRATEIQTILLNLEILLESGCKIAFYGLKFLSK